MPLVLSRSTHETLVTVDTRTGEVVSVTSVAQIRRGEVRLGIEADKRYAVYRGELWEAIQRGESKAVTPESEGERERKLRRNQ